MIAPQAAADGFKLGLEAYRIRLAHLFAPMMAVHTSNVQPLPHQITAVYEAMLPRQPLRYVLADDPGAGKTIMAGLFIRELLMRADAKRVLIVAPGSRVEQWQDELWEKFGVELTLFTSDLHQAARVNAFEENDLLIARLDQLSRNEDLQAKLQNSGWDLTVVDEAQRSCSPERKRPRRISSPRRDVHGESRSWRTLM
jgi:SNF2 family DNA or RNA helicase